MKEIIKIQQSLASSSGEQTMLIYNKNKSIYAVLPISKEVKKILGDNPKGYFEAILDRNGMLCIDKQVDAQCW